MSKQTVSTKQKFSERDQAWKDWMLKANNGDAEAYEMLLTDLSTTMRSYLRRRLRDEYVIEDITQEILLGIHKARASYDSAQAFGAWAFAIARYKFTDYLRKREKKIKREYSPENIDQYAEISTQNVDAEQISDSLEAALVSLPESQQKIVRSLKIDGRSVKETAQSMKMSESAVKVTAHRAYKKLKEKLLKGGV